MSRVFITGSSDGIGKLAAQQLIEQGHEVVVHARSAARAAEAFTNMRGIYAQVLGDLSEIRQMKSVAAQVNEIGRMDAVIHNAAVGYQERSKKVTADNLAQLFAVNSLAPYVLTSLIERPKRMIYISSGLHLSGDISLKDLNWENRPWSGYAAYSDSKLHDTILAFTVCRLWKDVYSNAIEPGWVPTKMGGPAAPDDLQKGAETQVWLAVSNDKDALVSGKYFFHKRQREPHTEAYDVDVQERFVAECERLSGVMFPR